MIELIMGRYVWCARVFILTLSLTIVNPSAFLGIEIAKAQTDNPTTVQDYYLLMPKQYDKSTRAEREEILGYSETTVDLENGHIEYVTHLSGQVFEAALFKRPEVQGPDKATSSQVRSRRVDRCDDSAIAGSGQQPIQIPASPKGYSHPGDHGCRREVVPVGMDEREI